MCPGPSPIRVRHPEFHRCSQTHTESFQPRSISQCLRVCIFPLFSVKSRDRLGLFWGCLVCGRHFRFTM